MWMLLAYLLLQPRDASPFLVITSTETPIESLTLVELRQLYLGSRDQIGSVAIHPVQVKRGDQLRKVFDRQVFGETFDLEEYWLFEKLKGNNKPPLTVNGWGLVMAYIARNPGYLGYIPRDQSANLDRDKLKIIEIR